MSSPHYRVVFTDAARNDLRHLHGAERLANIAAGALDRAALRALLTETTLGDLLDALEDVAVDPFGGPTISRSGMEDDRTGLFGTLAVTYMVSSSAQPPVVTITGVKGPKN